MPIAILISNLAITPMDNDVCALVASNRSGYFERRRLCVGDPRITLVPFASHGPLLSTRNNMLIFGHECFHGAVIAS